MSTATLEAPRVQRRAEEVAHLSPSIAKILHARSPMHAWDAHRHGGGYQSEPSEAMRNGRLYDRLLFGVGPEIVRIDADDWRTKAAKDQRDSAEAMGLIPILAHKLAVYEETVDRWRDQFEERGIELSGESQKRLVWTDNGVPCKGFADHVIVGPDSITIYDLKTCEDASPEACARAISNNGGDIQHAAYVDGVEALYPAFAGRVRMFFLFCEVSRPYAVNVVEPAGTMKALGRFKWRKAVETWGECLASGCFPGFEGITRVEAKAWQLDAAMGVDE